MINITGRAVVSNKHNTSDAQVRGDGYMWVGCKFLSIRCFFSKTIWYRFNALHFFLRDFKVSNSFRYRKRIIDRFKTTEFHGENERFKTTKFRRSPSKILRKNR